jgi:elongation factor 1-beta
VSVIAELRVMPEDPEDSLEPLTGRIRSALGEKLKSIREEPIGFGIAALRLIVLVEDREGGMGPIEEALKKVDGVGQIDVVSLDLA